MKVFYLQEASWELDFVRYDLCRCISDKMEIQIYNSKDVNSLKGTTPNKCMLIINHTVQFADAESLVKEIRPLVIFHMSDEHGHSPEWLSLSKYTKVLFRQYNYAHYNIQKYDNIIQIPLGYTQNFLSQKCSLDIKHAKINERNNVWSFIGQIKSDRMDMLNRFKETFETSQYYTTTGSNCWSIDNQKVSPQDTYAIYSDTIFVPIGRGNHSLDCFRIYEAVVAGALPVIVSNADEIKTTFSYAGKQPPFIYVPSWGEAVLLCTSLMEDLDKLQKIQYDIIGWWADQITGIQELVREFEKNDIKDIFL